MFHDHTGWVKKRKVLSEPLNNRQVFYFQNLIWLLFSTPKLRFWCTDILFSFTISRDVKSWIINSDLNIFKKARKTGYQSQTKSQRYVYIESLFIWALSCLCFFIQRPRQTLKIASFLGMRGFFKRRRSAENTFISNVTQRKRRRAKFTSHSFFSRANEYLMARKQ